MSLGRVVHGVKLLVVHQDTNQDLRCLETNILDYTEHTLSNYLFYDPVM